jgi:hypothetical protein
MSRPRPHRACIRVEDNEELEALKKRQPKGFKYRIHRTREPTKAIKIVGATVRLASVGNVKPAGAARGVKAVTMGDRRAWQFLVVAKDTSSDGTCRLMWRPAASYLSCRLNDMILFFLGCSLRKKEEEEL